jgi:hypothetical protein
MQKNSRIGRRDVLAAGPTAAAAMIAASGTSSNLAGTIAKGYETVRDAFVEGLKSDTGGCPALCLQVWRTGGRPKDRSVPIASPF